MLHWVQTEEEKSCGKRCECSNLVCTVLLPTAAPESFPCCFSAQSLKAIVTLNSLLVLDFRGLNLERWLVLDLAPQLAATSQTHSLPFEFRALEAILQHKVRPGCAAARWACLFGPLTPAGDVPVSSGLVTCLSVNRWTPCRQGWALWSLWYWTHWNPWWIPKSSRPTGANCMFYCRAARGEVQRLPHNYLQRFSLVANAHI